MSAQVLVACLPLVCAEQPNCCRTMVRVPTILHHLEFDYYYKRKYLLCESLSLLAVGHRNVLSLCYFITQGGNHSGWHDSWSADEHDDTGLPTRLTLFFSWKGRQAVQFCQVMQYSQHKTWTNTSGQPTCISLKTRSMISIMFVAILAKGIWVPTCSLASPTLPCKWVCNSF